MGNDAVCCGGLGELEGELEAKLAPLKNDAAAPTPPDALGSSGGAATDEAGMRCGSAPTIRSGACGRTPGCSITDSPVSP